jgi:hypothetical protein
MQSIERIKLVGTYLSHELLDTKSNTILFRSLLLIATQRCHVLSGSSSEMGHVGGGLRCFRRLIQAAVIIGVLVIIEDWWESLITPFMPLRTRTLFFFFFPCSIGGAVVGASGSVA